MTDATQDLNQVASAVQARIETEVLAALSGSEVFAQFVQAALKQKIEVEDRDSYRTRESTFLAETVTKAIQAATEAAVRKVIAEEAPASAFTVEALLSIHEAAARVGFKHLALRLAIKRGELPAAKLCGRIRIDPADLRRWIEAHRVEVTPP